MSEPTITVSAPAVEPWITAVAAVLRSFTTYALERQINGDLDECRERARVSEATAALFEDTLDAICVDEDDDTPEDNATPNQARPEVAETAPTQ